MYNRLECIGHLTRDIELKYLQSGAAVGKCAIATSYKYKDKEETMFIDFDIFGKGAEIMNQYCRKGSKIFIDGRLVLEQWTSSDGSNRSKHKLIVNDFTFLDSKNENQQQTQTQTQQYNRNDHQTSVPDVNIDDEEILF